MKKQASFSTQGHRADIGSLKIQRMLPNRYTEQVGPFVFLDYLAPALKENIDRNGMGAHPHRGIATLTYVLQGEVEHFDSAGNTAEIRSGGMQWMKAGNGIIHDENINHDTQTDSKYIQVFQFWINLPAKNKAEKPEHIAIQAEDVPIIMLDENSGWLKVVVGNYEDLNSKIPNYSYQFLYHIQLNAGKQFSLNFEENIELAAFLPNDNAMLNDAEYIKGDFVEFDRNAGELEMNNNSEKPVDIIIFGGERHTETVAAEGPFVMNSQAEITQAYRDFFAGKYGEIKIKSKYL